MSPETETARAIHRPPHMRPRPRTYMAEELIDAMTERGLQVGLRNQSEDEKLSDQGLGWIPVDIVEWQGEGNEEILKILKRDFKRHQDDGLLYRGDLVISVRTLQEKEDQALWELAERNRLEDVGADRDSLQSSLRDILAGQDMDPEKLSVMFTSELRKGGVANIDPDVARALANFTEDEMIKMKSMLAEYEMGGS